MLKKLINMLSRILINNTVLLFSVLIAGLFLIYSYFFASVVRTISEDELIKKGFDPVSYVDNIWDSKILPTIRNDSEEITFILDELFANKEVTEEKYGSRSGTGSYSFMVKGSGKITKLKSISHNKVMNIKLTNKLNFNFLEKFYFYLRRKLESRKKIIKNY